jgi:hypothetical protein
LRSRERTPEGKEKSRSDLKELLSSFLSKRTRPEESRGRSSTKEKILRIFLPDYSRFATLSVFFSVVFKSK